MIYLISSDRHKDSIHLEQYFITEEQIKKYVEFYYDYMFYKLVKNIVVDLEKLMIKFSSIYIEDKNWDTWDDNLMYLHKIEKYEKS